MKFHELIPILQMAIGPVILISGVGLLLLSMTNRLGRVIDRSRQMADAIRNAAPQLRSGLTSQLTILARRSRLVRSAITLATLSVLLAAIMIIMLFLGAILRWELASLVVVLFIACMTSLIASLVVFLKDLNLSLAALDLEIESNPIAQ